MANIVHAQGDFSNAFQSENHDKWENLDLANLDTSGVTNMAHMFDGETKLTGVGDLSGWDTSNVQSMDFMFKGCTSLAGELNLANWNLTGLSAMSFGLRDFLTGDNQITSLDISGWKFGHDSHNIGSLFQGLQGLELIDAEKVDAHEVNTMTQWFANNPNLKEIKGLENWNVENVDRMSRMFAGDTKLDKLDLSRWKTGKAIDMSEMFQGDSSLTSVGDLSNWLDIASFANNQIMHILLVI